MVGNDQKAELRNKRNAELREDRNSFAYVHLMGDFRRMGS